ncbi:hypothetical protein RvY_18941 [Ramazzottius varieornatus]|uniref:THAP-type domain-containing protein n=1 Tax=Ramazzottius varieornatus TaxID=947166 RepID=A0A1D1W7L8_RAMVA|nr:hypothetical protein RvY_18941 [Ramazzottius varieornatus]
MDRNESSDGMNMDDNLPFSHLDGAAEKTNISASLTGRESPSGSFSPEYSFSSTQFFSQQSTDGSGTVVSQSSSMVVTCNSTADMSVGGDSFLSELRRISGQDAEQSSGLDDSLGNLPAVGSRQKGGTMEETVKELSSLHNDSFQPTPSKQASSHYNTAEISEDEAEGEEALGGDVSTQVAAVLEESSPSSDGGQLVVSMAMNGLKDEEAIKQEPGIPLYDRSREGSVASRTSFISTEDVEEGDARRPASQTAKRKGQDGHAQQGGEEEEGTEEGGRRAPSTRAAAEASRKKASCVVPDCDNYQQSRANVFVFPDGDLRPLVRRKWLYALNTSRVGRNRPLDLAALKKNPNYGLCVKHFDRQEDFVDPTKPDSELTLKKDAVPTIFLTPEAAVTDASDSTSGKAKVSSSNSNGALAGISQYARKTIPKPAAKQKKKANGTEVDEEVEEEMEGQSSSDEGDLDDSDADEDWDKSAKKQAKKLDAAGLVAKRGRPSRQQMEEKKALAQTFAPTTKPYSRHDEAASYNRNGSPQKGGKSGSVITTVFLPKSILNGPLPPLQLNNATTTITTPAKTTTPIKVVQSKPSSQPVKSATKASASSTSQSIPAHRSSAPWPFKPAATPSPSQKVVVVGSAACPIVMPNRSPVTRQPIKLVLQKLPQHQEQVSPLRPPTKATHNMFKSARHGPVMGVGIQVEEEDLEPDSSDEEVQDILREAQEEILELKFSLEDALMDLSAEKQKNAHLETRVNAWIRAHFSASSMEAERLETLNNVATYYYDFAKKAEEGKRTIKAELELFRANFVRAQKETESYRSQIIELQGASTRELERIQQAKTRNEKEAQETIQTLRRQLADSAVAAEHAKRAQLAAEENVRRLNAGGGAALRPAAHHAAPQPAYAASDESEPTPPPKKRAPRGSNKKATAAATAQAQAIVAQRQREEQAAAEAAEAQAAAAQANTGRGRKRGRAAKEPSQSQTPSPAKDSSASSKKQRESSVDRAVRYLMSL